MNRERMLRVLNRQHMSEKTVMLGEKSNQVVFSIIPDATKKEIKTAVEKLFKVTVESVQVLNVKGKRKLFRQTMGQRKGWKKAYVQLAKGQDLNFTNISES